MNIVISKDQLDRLKKKLKDGERFIKCDSCKKLFTQTFHKGKKSLPICPWCGRHNTQFNENQDVEERSRSFAFTRKKRLFSKAELMANPDRYKKIDKDIKEIDVYKFQDTKSKKKPTIEDYKEVLANNTYVGDVGSYSYYYNIAEEFGSPTVTFFVLDKKNQEFVGYASFEMRYGNDFFVTLPYIRKEYRGQGIAMEIYKFILTMGSLISGKAQSHEAVGLWKKMFKELPNKMVYVDDDGKTFDVYEKNGDIYTSKTDKSVYETKGGYLKLVKN